MTASLVPNKHSRFSLKIAHKGLLVVVLPVLLQVAFLFVLHGLIQQSERQFRDETRAKDIVNQCQLLMQAINDAGAYNTAYTIFHSEHYAESYQLALAQIHSSQRKLHELLADDPAQLRELDRLNSATRQCLLDIETLRVSKEGRFSIKETLGQQQALAMMRASVKNVHREQKGIYNRARFMSVNKLPEEQARTRSAIIGWLLAIAVIDALLAILVATYFSRTITERLKVLVDNVRRFGAGRQLHPRLSGSDELTEFDEAFREMGQRMLEADRWRTEVAAAVRDTLSDPLHKAEEELEEISALGPQHVNQPVQNKLLSLSKEVKRLIVLLDDLQQVGAGRAEIQLHVQPVELQSVMDRSVDAVSGMAERYEVRLLSEPTAESIQADPERLTQLLVNLLSNAIKYSPPKGVVTINCGATADGVIMRITDRGKGISSKDLGKLFSAYGQLDITDSTVKGGSGLGLHICKQIVTAHGGSIGADSEVGEGSTFWVKLPRSATSSEAVAASGMREERHRI